jgi:hypothetical protein
MAARPLQPVGTLAIRLADCAASLILPRCAAFRLLAPSDSSTPRSFTASATISRRAPASALRDARCAMPAASMTVFERLTTMWLPSRASIAARSPLTICPAALFLAPLTKSLQSST